MKKLWLMASAMLAMFAAAGERVPLWPEGKIPFFQGHQIAAMTDEAGWPGNWKQGFDPKAHQMPYLEWCAAPAAEQRLGVCMILISGGGYDSCCDVGLVNDWEKRLTALGITCVKLVYRTPRPVGLKYHVSAWADGQRAVRLVRAEAAKRGFDPEKIGTISMSAGSHLATLLATSSKTPAYGKVDALDDTPCHLNWACTFAIAYGLTDGLGGPNARMGEGPDVKLDSIFKFDAKTCPMWMSHGGVDPYCPGASTQVYRELRRRNIPAELHLYADMPHGAFGFERAVEFMRQMGFLGSVPAEEELEQRFPKDEGILPVVKEEVWGRTPPNLQENQGTPYIEWFIPSNLTTKAIQIIYSGGAYDWNSPDCFEVRPAQRYLNAKGMAVVTMRYRVPRHQALAKHTAPWQDLQRAIKLVRSKAAEKGLDPNRIGIMGSSAGGHLTMMGITSSMHPAYRPFDAVDKLACNVQWGIAIYPAYLLTDGLDGENVRWGNDDSAVLAPEFTFDPLTCPTLFIHGDTDGYSAMGSVKAWEKMRLMGVQSELHTLATRKHCFQAKAAPGTGSYTWLDRIWEFLSAKRFNH